MTYQASIGYDAANKANERFPRHFPATILLCFTFLGNCRLKWLLYIGIIDTFFGIFLEHLHNVFKNPLDALKIAAIAKALCEFF